SIRIWECTARYCSCVPQASVLTGMTAMSAPPRYPAVARTVRATARRSARQYAPDGGGTRGDAHG
ncbi:MAG TPA: hypothetical protein VEH31_06575, partial [Streptosporangiaceae bacterium]|nr:hypothetical protein [Streptosporangiaceae bacterium]